MRNLVETTDRHTTDHQRAEVASPSSRQKADGMRITVETTLLAPLDWYGKRTQRPTTSSNGMQRPRIVRPPSPSTYESAELFRLADGGQGWKLWL
ncbi:MAG: hypothetical protein U0905_23150 [Pirellulales bacterium]